MDEHNKQICAELVDDMKIKDEMEERKTHEEFAKEVVQKTRPLTVPEESDECMREGYEHDPKVRGPRSRPEYDRRFKEYEEKFDPDGSMVAATKKPLSEDFDAQCEGGENDRH